MDMTYSDKNTEAALALAIVWGRMTPMQRRVWVMRETAAVAAALDGWIASLA